MSSSHSGPPSKYGVVLFDGFQSLDVFGPMDILNILSQTAPIQLSVLSATADPVSTHVKAISHTIGQAIVPTHAFQNAPDDIEVLLVPGGKGTRDLELTQPAVDYIKAAYPKLRYLLTVCTGSALAARAGALDGLRATSNKIAFQWVTTNSDKVTWVPKARWVADGKAWTSSGITAGIDMMYAFVAEQYGDDVAGAIAKQSEYIRNLDPNDDPFSSLV